MPRKPKARPLTEILKTAGESSQLDSLGRKRHKNQILADMMWEFAIDGKVTFPDGRQLQAAVRDWRDAASWIYHHTDGPAKPDVLVDLGDLDRQLAESSIGELKELVAKVFPDGDILSGHNPVTTPDLDAEDSTEVAEDTGTSEDS